MCFHSTLVSKYHLFSCLASHFCMTFSISHIILECILYPLLDFSLFLCVPGTSKWWHGMMALNKRWTEREKKLSRFQTLHHTSQIVKQKKKWFNASKTLCAVLHVFFFVGSHNKAGVCFPIRRNIWQRSSYHHHHLFWRHHHTRGRIIHHQMLFSFGFRK